MNWEDSIAKSSVPLFLYGLSLLGILFKFFIRKKIFQTDSTVVFDEDPIPLSHKSTTIFPTKDD